MSGRPPWPQCNCVESCAKSWRAGVTDTVSPLWRMVALVTASVQIKKGEQLIVGSTCSFIFDGSWLKLNPKMNLPWWHPPKNEVVMYKRSPKHEVMFHNLLLCVCVETFPSDTSRNESWARGWRCTFNPISINGVRSLLFIASDQPWYPDRPACTCTAVRLHVYLVFVKSIKQKLKIQWEYGSHRNFDFKRQYLGNGAKFWKIEEN